MTNLLLYKMNSSKIINLSKTLKSFFFPP